MSKKSDSDGSSFHDFVPLLFARNLAEAEFYKSLLEEHDIPVLIEDENTESMGLPDPGRGVPVLVPDEQLVAAEDILEQRGGFSEDADLAEFEDDEEEDELGDLEVIDPAAEAVGTEDEEEEEDEDEEEEES
jgi:hypothetical protein